MRSSALRRVGCSRLISKKPVTLPMLHLGGRDQRRRGERGSVDGLRALDTEDAFVLVREDFDEERLRVGPVLENPGGARAAGEVAMAREQGADFVDVGGINERLEIHAGLV